MTYEQFIDWLEKHVVDDIIDLYEAGYDAEEIANILIEEYQIPSHFEFFMYDFVILTLKELK